MARDARWIALGGSVLATATLGGAACKRAREEPPRSAAAGPPGAAAPAPAPPLAATALYRIDVGPRTPCAAGSPCEARLVLTALGGFHVNRDYPFKFVGDPAPGLALEGTGVFALDDARTGTLTLRYRAARPGSARFTGTFKLSVCDGDRCEIEQPKIEFSL